MKLAPASLAQLSQEDIDRAEKTLSRGTWLITFGAIVFSMLTVTPLVASVTPARWGWTAPILPVVVDAAVVIVIRLESVVARLGVSAGRWPAILRWVTAVLTLGLNVGLSALRHSWVGVGVHLCAPVLLILVSEAGRGYRHAIARALDRQATERAAAEADAERERREQQDRDRADREREREQQLARERSERDDADRREREAREHELTMQQQQAAHAAQLEADRAAREDRERQAAAQAERERDERRRRDQREQRDHELRLAEQARLEKEAEAARAAAPAPREQTVFTEASVNTGPADDAFTAPTVNETVNADADVPADAEPAEKDKKAEDVAVNIVLAGAHTKTVRELAAATGWSIGWVQKTLRAAADDDNSGLSAAA